MIKKIIHHLDGDETKIITSDQFKAEIKEYFEGECDYLKLEENKIEDSSSTFYEVNYGEIYEDSTWIFPSEFHAKKAWEFVQGLRRDRRLSELSDEVADSIKDATKEDFLDLGQEINEKAPVFKGCCTIIHSQSGFGKTTLMQKMVESVKANHPEIQVVVVMVDERPVEYRVWNTLADKLVNLSSHRRLSVGAIGMWEKFQEIYLTCIEDAYINKKDILLIIDSCNMLANVAEEAGIVPKGNTVPGGVDKNSINLIGSYLCLSGLYEKGGSLTIWGTCLLQDSKEALCKGSSAILSSKSRVDFVLDEDHSLNRISRSRLRNLIKDYHPVKSGFKINPVFMTRLAGSHIG